MGKLRHREISQLARTQGVSDSPRSLTLRTLLQSIDHIKFSYKRGLWRNGEGGEGDKGTPRLKQWARAGTNSWGGTSEVGTKPQQSCCLPPLLFLALLIIVMAETQLSSRRLASKTLCAITCPAGRWGRR